MRDRFMHDCDGKGNYGIAVRWEYSVSDCLRLSHVGCDACQCYCGRQRVESVQAQAVLTL